MGKNVTKGTTHLSHLTPGREEKEPEKQLIALPFQTRTNEICFVISSGKFTKLKRIGAYPIYFILFEQITQSISFL